MRETYKFHASHIMLAFHKEKPAAYLLAPVELPNSRRLGNYWIVGEPERTPRLIMKRQPRTTINVYQFTYHGKLTVYRRGMYWEVNDFPYILPEDTAIIDANGWLTIGGMKWDVGGTLVTE
ncbi:MAG: hypothetical protein QXS68_08260 [Candidatus Methanomethylicaceae archaeon]